MVSLWQILGVRMAVGWLLVSVSPAVILFWDYVIVGDWQLTQLNSLIVSSVVVMISLWALDRFTQFPGQRAMVTVLPTVLTVSMLAGLVLLVFRVPYSVYYLALSLGVGVLFCFVSQYYLKLHIQPCMGYVPIGRCLSLPEIEQVNWVELDVNYLTKTNHKLSKLQAVVADLADDNMTAQWTKQLAETTLRGIPVYNVLQVRESLTGRIPIHHLHENNLGSLLPSPYYLMFKRLVDSLIILISLPIVLPLALLVVFGIWCDDKKNNAKASVIFTQERIGQGAKPFKMYKFRSMIPSSETQGAKMATTNDKRITQFGRFIRKTRLDELPQFINVLKGEMSLIGPRPEQPSFVAQFNESIPFYAYRHIVRPGISGWAQVMHGYASDEDETKVKLEHDFYYIKNFSPTLDLLIVIKTIQTMLTGFGAR